MRNGHECLRLIKADKRYRHIPIVIYTVSMNKKDIEETYREGAHYYVVKPYAYANFLEAMKKVFSIDWNNVQVRPPKEQFVINLTFN